MKREHSLVDLLEKGNELLLPSISVDCVIFGYHNNMLKVLLLKQPQTNTWALPGGFIYKNEDVDAAALRVLKSRTGLSSIFLQQFHLFGNANRTREKHAKKLLQTMNIAHDENHWLLQRFVSMGYYALVEHGKINIDATLLAEEYDWKELNQLPTLIIDHQQIIAKALVVIRYQLNYQPIGLNLLPEEFTIKDLQLIYEAILGKILDRRNFQRKILGYDILEKREKQFTGKAHKAPYLYSFNKQKYLAALQDGLYKVW